MKRVIIINWKKRPHNPVEVFSNLKLLCESYPVYSYNTLNNYLSKKRIAYDTDEVRIERKQVHTKAIPQRKIAMVVNRVSMHDHNDEEQDRAYWLSRPPAERIEAVTRLRAQFIKEGERLDKTKLSKRRI